MKLRGRFKYTFLIPTVMSLKAIRKNLEECDNLILGAILLRMKYRANPKLYECGIEHSQLGHALGVYEHKEKTDGEFGDWTKRPFCSQMIASEDPSIPDYRTGVNFNSRIFSDYLKLLSAIASEGFDLDTEKVLDRDIKVLKMVSERVHQMGLVLVADQKYSESRESLMSYITVGDEEGLCGELRNEILENRKLEHIRRQVTDSEALKRLGVSITNPELVVNFFRDVVIKSTLEGEAKYLMLRYGRKES